MTCSDAARTQETLEIMQASELEFSKAVVHFMPSFYSVAAMDGQTAAHLQQVICEYSTDKILTLMYDNLTSSLFRFTKPNRF